MTLLVAGPLLHHLGGILSCRFMQLWDRHRMRCSPADRCHGAGLVASQGLPTLKAVPLWLRQWALEPNHPGLGLSSLISQALGPATQTL